MMMITFTAPEENGKKVMTMAEYIERGALMQFPIRRDHCDRENGNEHFINGIETVLEYAENLPAADVAPVVRCQDCTKFEQKGKYYNGRPFGYCYHWDYEEGSSPNEVDGDDFCSYGERRAEAGS